jgi:hypothetical protein
MRGGGGGQAAAASLLCGPGLTRQHLKAVTVFPQRLPPSNPTSIVLASGNWRQPWLERCAELAAGVVSNITPCVASGPAALLPCCPAALLPCCPAALLPCCPAALLPC